MNENNLLMKLQNLAKIKIEDDKKDELIGYIHDVSSWFMLLSSINTDNIDLSLSQLTTFNDHTDFRCDNILENKKTVHEYFVVPKVIEN